MKYNNIHPHLTGNCERETEKEEVMDKDGQRQFVLISETSPDKTMQPRPLSPNSARTHTVHTHTLIKIIQLCYNHAFQIPSLHTPPTQGRTDNV